MSKRLACVAMIVALALIGPEVGAAEEESDRIANNFSHKNLYPLPCFRKNSRALCRLCQPPCSRRRELGCPGSESRVLMDVTRDLARWFFRTAPRLEWAEPP
jgi:hypothetical protein